MLFRSGNNGIDNFTEYCQHLEAYGEVQGPTHTRSFRSSAILDSAFKVEFRS